MAMDKDKLAELLRDAGLGHYVEAILQYAKLTIRLHARPVENPEALPLGTSHIGGLHDMPPNANWPTRNGRPCEFIAQINLKEVSQFDQSGLLPKGGLILFFYDPFYVEGEDFQQYQKGSESIIYYTGDVSSLEKATKYPENLHENQHYPPCTITFEADWMLPAWPGAVAYTLEHKVLQRQPLTQYGNETPIVKAYELITDKLEPDKDPDKHHMFGYPQPVVQDDPLYYISSAFAQDTFDVDEEKLEEWVLLLQISSDYSSSSGMLLWSDSGSLYYYIRKDDLIAKRFENAVCEGQSY
jgi:uncharacterized protein YwqG